MTKNNNFDKKWYVLQVSSGSEDKTAKYIKYYYNYFKLNNLFGEIIIPKEEVIEIKNGKKKKSNRIFFPGYIFINMIVNNDSLNMINKVKNVFGFVKYGFNLTYIKDEEINIILDRINKSIINPKPKIIFCIGENIRVNDGPFSDFNGIVENIDYIKNKIIVSVSIFGRYTPIELNFNQIEKIN